MGKLYIIGTPIGNLKDISLRAVETLKESDVIFVEDKRVTVKLLNSLEIGKKELFTFSEYNANKVLKKALDIVKQKNICSLVSDAGMPVISDPGYQLINKCWEEGIEIDIIPGPNAPSAAIALSGFPGSKYMFYGFLPRGKNKRRVLRNIKDIDILFVFFESPQRLVNTLKEILEIIGDRDIFIAREMTKIHQELFRGKVSEALAHFSENKVRGEITVVLSGRDSNNETV
ncbi:ribosomal RNA small subunit methyltransferase I [Marinitoga sp. 1135]|uniref:Ribosomal RNA small subunit methyltransferase I n=1 Tax=Marinitoga piezophila (strain DSM 14283 / JCM 11233 / KA3) TaxID=443254 RepID=H2J4F4_MARPK|nr:MULTISPECIES: 16S rRNA (cytidine(1402)-2'-O)-methyltransferase [Marinitoga]AEX84809.1 putative S-adenosylmethionine-dependent methyltransferase, YraL family [Marinitoga piezophila KA3]APT75319.1 ribosomal RNA small subunit methyltransferase I [Marinitoga sp. 1137]NUU95052.1 ribosomal RNA small subunit methyltransferase I [Marinitoga sp. 1135]NUU97006.1 ribosomal RNA small subunit methyltransferase I [Marinitoga sp. 1138]